MSHLESILDLGRFQNRFDLWCEAASELKFQSVAEIGVWKADFAARLLADCPSIERYYLIDPWAQLPDWNKPWNVSNDQFDEVYAEAISKTKFAASKLEVLRGRTLDVIDAVPDESLDFAYIDGDHTLRGIMIDLIKVLPKVRNGGILAGDDFVRTPWQHGASFEPTLVCPAAAHFAEAHGFPIVVLPHGQFAMLIDADSSYEFHDTTGRYGNLSLRSLQSSSAGSGSGLRKKLGRRVRRVVGQATAPRSRT